MFPSPSSFLNKHVFQNSGLERGLEVLPHSVFLAFSSFIYSTDLPYMFAIIFGSTSSVPTSHYGPTHTHTDSIHTLKL